MTEFTDFSTGLKELPKAPCFTIFCMTVTENTVRAFPKVIFLHPSSQQQKQRGQQCQGGKDHKLQGPRDLNLESWFSHSLAM